jgi:hypothetical protein
MRIACVLALALGWTTTWLLNVVAVAFMQTLPSMKLLLLFAACFLRHVHADVTLPSELLASLVQAGLENTDSLTEALHTIELHSLRDIRMLDTGERAEMFALLQGMNVGLGSRAKLRRLAGVSALLGGSAGALEKANWSTAQTEFPRQLQQGSGGGSMDSIALAVTALLGIASYLVQAKISREAERSQKDSDRAHVDRARAESKAEQQLARVMTQIERFVVPLNTSYVQLAEAIYSTMGEIGLAAQIEH